MEKQWAVDVGVSDDVAARVFAATGPIYDFHLMHQDDPRFGAAWMEYGDADQFEVWVRMLDQSFSEEASGLGQLLGIEVQTALGGSSYAEQATVISDLREIAKHGISVRVNLKDGTYEVPAEDAGAAAAVLPAEHIREVERRQPAEPVVTNGADLNFTSVGAYCTVGYFWSNGSQRGLTTAAHCADSVGYSNPGHFPTNGTTYWESCAADVQHMRITSGSPGNWVYFKPNSNVYDWSTFPADLAGGVFATQPTYAIGHGSNATRTVGGEIVAWDTWPVAADPLGECPLRNVAGLTFTPAMTGGDSGGPMVVYYEGDWFLVTTTVSTYPSTGESLGAPIGWYTSNLPAGSYVCTASSATC